MPGNRTRVYLSDVEAICQANDSIINRHPITRHFTLVLNSGNWCWVINPHTGEAITSLTELTIEEWKGVIAHTVKLLSTES